MKTLVECFNVNDGGKLGFNWILKSRNSSTLPFEVFDLTGNLEIIWKLGQWRAADLYVRMKYVKLLFYFENAHIENFFGVQFFLSLLLRLRLNWLVGFPLLSCRRYVSFM